MITEHELAFGRQFGEAFPAPFVSLGRDCEVNFQLRRSGWWTLPSPFDPAVTPFAALRSVLDTGLDGIADDRSWALDGQALVHRDLPLSVRHLRFDGQIGASAARLRLGATALALRHFRTMGISPVFFRIADDPAELAESEGLLQRLSSYGVSPRLVHVRRATSDHEWREHGADLVHATVTPGSTWRGDRGAWRRLLTRAGAWSGTRRPTPSVAAAGVFSILAPMIWGEEWDRVVHGLKRGREQANRANIDPLLIATLIAAEDRRFFRHAGVDFGRTLRAGFRLAVGRPDGGGSTIEQQLVRVLTGKMERTLTRKLREIVAAAAVGKELSKKEIAIVYLLNGYFGLGKVGISRAANALGFDSAACTPDEAALVISCLKYPRSPDENPLWTARREERVRWLRSKMTSCSAG